MFLSQSLCSRACGSKVLDKGVLASVAPVFLKGSFGEFGD